MRMLDYLAGVVTGMLSVGVGVQVWRWANHWEHERWVRNMRRQFGTKDKVRGQ